MPVERRGWVIAFEIGSTGNGRNPIFNGRRQPSCGGTSRMTRECQVRICERLGGKFPGQMRRNQATVAINGVCNNGDRFLLSLLVCFTTEKTGDLPTGGLLHIAHLL